MKHPSSRPGCMIHPLVGMVDADAQGNPVTIPPCQHQTSTSCAFYTGFSAPVTAVDCGRMCAPHNPHGIPFCCDICHAVPAVYHQEWEYLRLHTDLWHPWRGRMRLRTGQSIHSGGGYTGAHASAGMQGPAHCQREYRSSSCRQFPFFPYITANDRFIGMTYHWDFEPTCWVIRQPGCCNGGLPPGILCHLVMPCSTPGWRSMDPTPGFRRICVPFTACTAGSHPASQWRGLFAKPSHGTNGAGSGKPVPLAGPYRLSSC